MESESQRRQQGFTLIELLVVLVIIGIVASIGIVAVMNALDKAKQRATMADMRTLSKAIEIYSADHGFLPFAEGGGFTELQSVLTPYQSSTIPVRDAWGHLYSYARADTGDYTIESYGKDGVAGEDITVATKDDFMRDIVISNGQFVAAPQ